MERRWLGSRRSETVGDLAPEGTNPGHVGRKQRHTRVALNAHTGCVASAPHQNHQHHIHNSCTSPPPRRTSHHIAYIHTRAHASNLSPLSPPGFERATDFSTNFTRPRSTVTVIVQRNESLGFCLFFSSLDRAQLLHGFDSSAFFLFFFFLENKWILRKD